VRLGQADVAMSVRTPVDGLCRWCKRATAALDWSQSYLQASWLQGGMSADVQPGHSAGGGSSLQLGAVQPRSAAEAAPVNSHLQAIAELLTPDQAGPVLERAQSAKLFCTSVAIACQAVIGICRTSCQSLLSIRRPPAAGTGGAGGSGPGAVRLLRHPRIAGNAPAEAAAAQPSTSDRAATSSGGGLAREEAARRALCALRPSVPSQPAGKAQHICQVAAGAVR
jgi:hypothetical protein